MFFSSNQLRVSSITVNNKTKSLSMSLCLPFKNVPFLQIINAPERNTIHGFIFHFNNFATKARPLQNINSSLRKPPSQLSVWEEPGVPGGKRHNLTRFGSPAADALFGLYPFYTWTVQLNAH